jgi:hypothetical protein
MHDTVLKAQYPHTNYKNNLHYMLHYVQDMNNIRTISEEMCDTHAWAVKKNKEVKTSLEFNSALCHGDT